MAVIVPTITAFSPHEYREQYERVSFAKRLHIDVTDGEFAPSRTVNLAQVYWDEDKVADLHLMFKKPADHLEQVISLKPNLVIVHAEAQGNLLAIQKQLKPFGTKFGVALLSNTKVDDHTNLVQVADHVLIFIGKLGYHGGTFDPVVLPKFAAVKALNPTAELSIDGGVNSDNAAQIVKAGVDVLNVGSFIHNAKDPKTAYDTLKTAVA